MSAITLFEQKQVRRAWEQATGKWYFAIVDVIAVLTDSANPQVYWRMIKKRLGAAGGSPPSETAKLTARPGTMVEMACL